MFNTFLIRFEFVELVFDECERNLKFERKHFIFYTLVHKRIWKEGVSLIIRNGDRTQYDVTTIIATGIL